MRIEIDTGNQTMTVEGVQITFALLGAMVRPDAAMLYQFRREELPEPTIIIRAWRDAAVQLGEQLCANIKFF
jgi:hypothetical protein